jgi:hypothetical protein
MIDSSMDYKGFTQSDFNGAFDYDPVSGDLIKRKSGRLITNCDRYGYLRTSVNRVGLLAHRVAFLMHYGYLPRQIDHINHKKDDNRIDNLRPATHDQNHKNKPLFKNNRSGHNGVYFCNKTQKWKSFIYLNNKSIHLGYYDLIEDAIKARSDANKKYRYHENHGNPLNDI